MLDQALERNERREKDAFFILLEDALLRPAIIAIKLEKKNGEVCEVREKQGLRGKSIPRKII